MPALPKGIIRLLGEAYPNGAVPKSPPLWPKDFVLGRIEGDRVADIGLDVNAATRRSAATMDSKARRAARIAIDNQEAPMLAEYWGVNTPDLVDFANATQKTSPIKQAMGRPTENMTSKVIDAMDVWARAGKHPDLTQISTSLGYKPTSIKVMIARARAAAAGRPAQDRAVYDPDLLRRLLEIDARFPPRPGGAGRPRKGGALGALNALDEDI